MTRTLPALRSALCAAALACGAAGAAGTAPAQPAWQPSPGTSWQIQLQGKLNIGLDVQAYDIDLFDTAQTHIDGLRARGVKVICYFNAGGYEDWRPDADQFPPEVLGGPLGDWPGERWLDIRRIDLLAPIMGARLDLAVAKGCDAVDPDNVDGFANKTKLPLTAADQLAYNRWIAGQARQRGLAVGLKNDLKQVKDLVGDFDFAVNEQCVQYNECDRLTPFIAAGKAVFGIEYSGKPAKACRVANRLDFDTLIKRMKLDAWRQACR